MGSQAPGPGQTHKYLAGLQRTPLERPSPNLGHWCDKSAIITHYKNRSNWTQQL